MKISIITVCYNSRQTIERAIKSVLGQGFEELEYIVIDGGSKDGTIDIIERYRDGISYFCSEPDEGIYDAMNKGLQHATGDVIAFLNSDDWYEPETFRQVEKYFSDDSIDGISGEVHSIVLGKNVDWNVPEHTEEDIHVYMIYNHPAMFLRKRVFEKVGFFDMSYKIAADYDLVLRAHNAGVKILEVPEILTNFSKEGISAIQMYRSGKEAKEIALKHVIHQEKEIRDSILKRYNLEDYYNRTLMHLVCQNDKEYVKRLLNGEDAIYIWGAGGAGKASCELMEEAGISVEGFIDKDSNKTKFCGIKVYTPEQVAKDIFVCIGTINYEKEVAAQLEQMNIKRYISYSSVMKQMIEYGREHFSHLILE